MSDAPSTRNIIQQEAVVSRRPTAESLLQPMASSINLMLKEGYETVSFKVNGPYKGIVGQYGLDGFFRFKYDAFIFAADFFNQLAGTSGTTEGDVQLASAPGGPFTSIFATTPKISFNAGNNTWIGTGETGTGLIAPVLTTAILNVNAGNVLRFGLPAVMNGNPKNTQLNLYYLQR